VPDRQAIEMVKYHLGWKLALHLNLTDPGFHPTTLVYFRQRLLEHAGLQRPPELYADGGYISGPRLQRTAQEGWSLMGPAPASPRRPGVDRLPVEDFNVSIAQRRACCPAGHQSGHCSRLQLRQKAGIKVFYRFEWRKGDCQSCPLREKCVPPGQKHRFLIVGEHHEFLQQRGQEQVSAALQQRMHQRNAIEDTLSELTRGHGMRRSRYRGFGKVELQNLLIGTACNIKRWLRTPFRKAKGPQTRASGLHLSFQSPEGGVSACWRNLFGPAFSPGKLCHCFVSC
jgi:hypothetical protein